MGQNDDDSKKANELDEATLNNLCPRRMSIMSKQNKDTGEYVQNLVFLCFEWRDYKNTSKCW